MPTNFIQENKIVNTYLCNKHYSAPKSRNREILSETSNSKNKHLNKVGHIFNQIILNGEIKP